MEEVLLMDVIVNPEVIPHNVTHAFLASAILIAVALAVRGSIELVPKGHPEFHGDDCRRDMETGR